MNDKKRRRGSSRAVSQRSQTSCSSASSSPSFVAMAGARKGNATDKTACKTRVSMRLCKSHGISRATMALLF
jgi:hypothetical protein